MNQALLEDALSVGRSHFPKDNALQVFHPKPSVILSCEEVRPAGVKWHCMYHDKHGRGLDGHGRGSQHAKKRGKVAVVLAMHARSMRLPMACGHAFEPRVAEANWWRCG